VDRLKRIQELTPYTTSPELEVAWYDTEPAPPDWAEFLARRATGEPYAKIMGHKGFWKGDFKVSPYVLDPRPDSEVLIEAVLTTFPDKNVPLKILDIGTGSGCLLASLLTEYSGATGVGIDISEQALQVAKENLGPLPATLYARDFYGPDWGTDLGCFDIIISNPPYIKTGDLPGLDKGTRFDPVLALDGGKDGLKAYRALAKSTPALLTDKGALFLEIGQGQEQDVGTLFQKAGFSLQKTFMDYGGIPRILLFQK